MGNMALSLGYMGVDAALNGSGDYAIAFSTAPVSSALRVGAAST